MPQVSMDIANSTTGGKIEQINLRLFNLTRMFKRQGNNK